MGSYKHLISLGVVLLLTCEALSFESIACPIAPSSDPTAFSKINFDFLIIGGGTAGMTLASRLSENKAFNVGVIEAGIFRRDDPLVDVPANSGIAIGNATYDWNFATQPEAALAGRVIPAPRGKMLGGSSGLNLLAWTRPSKEELDAYDSFAPGLGWNWNGLLPYLKKVENVQANQINPFPGIPKVQGNPGQQNLEGTTGPIHASLNVIYPDDVSPFVQSLNARGVATNPSPDNGTTRGVRNTLLSIDRASGTRSYAATAIFCPTASRKNLHVLTKAQATKIVFNQGRISNGNLSAQGVQFVVGQKTFVANAKREIILSAGAVQSPQLLELSGIGNPAILKKAGVNSLLSLSGVGENLQEHIFSPAQFLLQPGVHTFDDLRNNATFAALQATQYQNTRTGFLAASDSTLSFSPLSDFVSPADFASLSNSLQLVASQPGLSPLQAKQYAIQKGWLSNKNIPQAEIVLLSKGIIFPAVNQSYISLLGGIQHPLSRGSVHINSTNPLAPPVIIGNYLSNAFDLGVVKQIIKFICNLPQVQSLGQIVQAIQVPANFQTDADLEQHVRTTSSVGDHLIGTAVMAPRNIGGVVDGRLKVYNTANLRVVDASIIPLLPAAHLQALVYAIGAKAGDMILQDN